MTDYATPSNFTNPAELLPAAVFPYEPQQYAHLSGNLNSGKSSISVKIDKKRFLRKGSVEKNVFSAASLHIEYVPGRYLLEWTKLNDYLDSYLEWSGTGEAATLKIYEDIHKAINPVKLEIIMKFDHSSSGGWFYEVKTV